MEVPANDPSVANYSNTPTLAGSAAPSRVASAKKASRPPSRSDSIRLSADDDSVVVPVKDRAPPFVVALCLFQSLAGLLFGFVFPRLSFAPRLFVDRFDRELTSTRSSFLFVYRWEQGVIAGLVQNGDCELNDEKMRNMAERLTCAISFSQTLADSVNPMPRPPLASRSPRRANP